MFFGNSREWFRLCPKRSKPKFRQGQLVYIPASRDVPYIRYFLIERRRWVRPDGEKQKQWVYDGAILKVVNEKLELSTFGSCFYERSFMKMYHPD